MNTVVLWLRKPSRRRENFLIAAEMTLTLLLAHYIDVIRAAQNS